MYCIYGRLKPYRNVQLCKKKELDILNAEREPKCREEWEFETAMPRMNLRRNPSGRKLEWKFLKK